MLLSGLLSTKPSFSVTDYNSKLPTYLHPRSVYVWLRFVASHTKRRIVVCSALNLPPCPAHSPWYKNSVWSPLSFAKMLSGNETREFEA
jgi:hypothetical protein